jgi:ABC-type transport system substrate-binding protein
MKVMLRLFSSILVCLFQVSVAHEILYPISSRTIHLNPTLDLNSDSAVVRNQVFAGLVKFGDNFKIEPSIANSWKISADGLTYSFSLSSKIFWENNKPILCHEIAEYYKALLATNTERHWLFSGLKGLKTSATISKDQKLGIACAGNVITFDFKKPNNQFLQLLSSNSARIGKREKEVWLGTGHFKLLSQNDEELVLMRSVKNLEKGKIQKIVFKKIAGRDDISALLKEKKFDLFSASSRDLVETIDKNYYQISSAGSLQARFLIMNHQTGYTRSASFRAALARGIDTRRIGQLSGAYIPNQTDGIGSSDMLNAKFGTFLPAMDKIASKKELAKALPKGQTIEFIYSLRGQGKTLEAPKLMIEELETIGIKVKEVKLNYDEYLVRIQGGKFELALVNFRPDYPTLDAYFYGLLATGAPDNLGKFSNKSIDELLELSRAENNPIKVTKIYETVIDKLKQEVPLIPLYRNENIFVYRKNLRVPANDIGVSFLDFDQITAE